MIDNVKLIIYTYYKFGCLKSKLKKGIKMNEEDFNADIEMCFRQIVSLTDLMLEYNNENVPNILQ